jgi:hypothetical protein
MNKESKVDITIRLAEGRGRDCVVTVFRWKIPSNGRKFVDKFFADLRDQKAKRDSAP